MTPTFAVLRAEYAALWRDMAIDPRRAPAILAAARRTIGGMDAYRCVAAAVWAAIVMAFASAGVPGTWIAVYPVLMVFDALNVVRAMSDAAAAEIAARHPAAA